MTNIPFIRYNSYKAVTESCSTMRALGVLSSAFSLNAGPRQGACQVDRCIARKSKMATKTIMSFREGLCTHYFSDSIFGMTMSVSLCGHIEWNNLN